MTELLFRDDAYLQRVSAVVAHLTQIATRDGSAMAPAVVLDRTNFYFESGGQPGDTGTLTWRGGSLAITDTRKDRETGAVLHVLQLLSPGAPLPTEGEAVDIELDWPRRHAHMRYHTALHLVCAALPGILATGNSIDATKARIDFDLSGVEFERDVTETRLNALIAGEHDVAVEWITDAEMAAQPELVRTMSVAPPTGAGRVRLLKIGDNIDLQPCGGTHVRNTREIGPVKIIKVENKGRQNRRLVIQCEQASPASTADSREGNAR